MEREKFSSRLGFILISAGCAIGLGNVWRFPYITGKYGGAAFVLVYLVFLLILGLPIMVMEFSVGRASQKSAALSFNILEPKGAKWHLYRYGAMAGQLSAHDVLYHGGRLDVLLCLQNVPGRVQRPGRGGGGDGFLRYAGPAGAYDRMDAGRHLPGIWDLLPGAAKRCGAASPRR